MSEPDPIKIAVVGAGLIGQRHCDVIAGARGAQLYAIADPSDTSQDFARDLGVAHFSTLAQLLADGGADGVILATPNQMHVDNGLECVAAGLPFLVEKPLSSDAQSGARLVAAAKAANVAMLVGHHRRYNPIVEAAKAQIEAGALGQITTIHAQFWLYKPDDYFRTGWRSAAGGGPLFINFIHDIDLMRHFCGDVVEVQAMQGANTREHGAQESIVVNMRFASGAIGTASISDSTVAPWSWELTAGENPAYPKTAQACYMIGGSEGALSIPDLKFWAHEGAKSWWSDMSARAIAAKAEDPLERQIAHFCDVIAGSAVPKVSGEAGLAALQIIEAIQKAIETRASVTL